jgi:hypothetical protein
MSILAFVSDQHSIGRILDHLGLRSSQQDKPPPAREVLRVAEAGEGSSATPHRLDRPTASWKAPRTLTQALRPTLFSPA